MRVYIYLLAVCALLLTLSACKLFEYTRSLDELKNLSEIDRIEIQVLKQDEQGIWTDYFTKTIDDPRQIRRITAAFQNYADDWRVGYSPYLPGRLTVVFYREEKLIIPIIVVSYPNTSGGLSYFLSRPAGPARPIEEAEFKKLMELLELDEGLAYFGDLKISTDAP
jgi:hypothetical protein